VEKQTNIV